MTEELGTVHTVVRNNREEEARLVTMPMARDGSYVWHLKFNDGSYIEFATNMKDFRSANDPLFKILDRTYSSEDERQATRDELAEYIVEWASGQP